MICFFVKNCKVEYCAVISCEVIKILANFDLKYMKRKLSYNFIASLTSLVKKNFYKRKRPEKTACNFNKT